MKFEVEGIEAVKALVEDYTKSLRTMQPLFEKIEKELEDQVNDALNNQRSATTGRGYKPLTPTTVLLEGKAPNTALKSKSGFSRVVSLKVDSSNRATISTSIPYGAIHQFGNPDNTLFGHRAPIPARQFLPIKKGGGFTDRFEKRLSEITQAWLAERKARRRR